MRFVLIGDSAEAAFITEAIDASDKHELVCCCVDDSLARELVARRISCQLVPSAEEAFTAATAEAVIVAVTDVDRSVQLVRQASQADLHVLVIPPDSVSVAFSYEVHLLLDESKRGIVPLTGRWYLSPTLACIQGALSEAGRIRDLTFDCGLNDSETLQQRMQLLGIDALGGCGFQYSQVTGMDLPAADGTVLTRTITLATAKSETEAGVPPAMLSFKQRSSSMADVSLVVSNNDDSVFQIETALPCPSESTLARASTSMVDRVAARLCDSAACQRGMVAFSNTLELKAGLDKSFRRRRTIDVYFDGVSERGAFKTQMTAIGCGVLTYVIFGMIGFLVIAQLTELPPWALKTARVVWIAPVVLYLAAQLLLPLSRERGSAQEPVEEPKSESSG